MAVASSQTNDYQVRVFPPHKQGTGSFDGGRITEIKPIGFRGDGASVSRVGPLFYWAWASANGPAKIGLHPHRGFEIASYVLKGELGHADTGNHKSRIGIGGVQVMQTGSGISHEEQTFDETEFFQIWFEPDLREALNRVPTYREASDTELPVKVINDVRIKSIIGGDSPIHLVTDVHVAHLTLEANATHTFDNTTDRTNAVVVIDGEFEIQTHSDELTVRDRDFLLIPEGADTQLHAKSTGGEVVVVNVPTSVSYPLLDK